MPVQIRRADLYAYVINALERDIGQFKKAMEDHAKTVDVPAPIAVHTLVEAIAKSPDGAFIVAEDVAEAEKNQTPMATLNDHNTALARITDLETRAPIKGAHDQLMSRIVELEGQMMALKEMVKIIRMEDIPAVQARIPQ